MTRYNGPKLWLDKSRGTWTIMDGRLRLRTGCTEHQRELAEKLVDAYANGTYQPDSPQGPVRTYKTPPRKGVYVIGFGPYVKIGVSLNIDERMRGLQAPEKVVLYGIIDGWVLHESRLHGIFSDYRLNGEWFRKEGAVAEWIEQGCPYPE